MISTLSPLMWPALGGLIAIFLEVTYRRADSFPLWAIIPALMLTYCIYRVVSNTDTSYLLAIAAFNVFALTARVGASLLIFHEPLVRGNLVALSAFVVAMGARYWK